MSEIIKLNGYDIADNEARLRLGIDGNAVWIGDSYVQANSLGADQNQRFSTKVSELLQVTEFNYAIGGTGLLAPAGSTYYDQLLTAISGMSADEIAHTKYVFVCGGRNDVYNVPTWTLTDLNGAVYTLFTTIRDRFPNALIVGIPMLWDAGAMPFEYQEYLSALHQCMTNQRYRVRSITIANAWTWLLGKHDSILTDGVHPDIKGHGYISIMIYNAIMGSDSEAAPRFFSFTGKGLTFDVKMYENIINVTVSGTPSEAIDWGDEIVSQNLGPNPGITNLDWQYITCVSRGGDAMAIQYRFVLSYGDIYFKAQCLTNTPDITYGYWGNATAINGLRR